MNNRGQKGQVTIFLSIILLALIVLIGVLVDGSRIYTGSTQVKRAVAVSTRSAIAGYSSKLKNEYGIFSLSVNDENKLKDIISGYLEKNLMIKSPSDDQDIVDKAYEAVKGVADAGSRPDNSSYLNLFDYRIENIKVTPVFNLSENGVVKNQILEYMKYRAPKEIVEGIWDKFTAVNESSRMSEAYKRKIKVDRLAGKVARAQEKLKKNADGTIGDGKDIRYFINLFNRNGSRDNLAGSYANLVMKYKSLLENLKKVLEEIRSVRSQLSSATDEKTIASLQSRLAGLESIRDQLSDEIDKIKKSIKAAYDELHDGQTGVFIEPNENAKANLQDIIKLGGEIKSACGDLKSFLNMTFTNDSASDISKGFKELMGSDTLKIEGLIPDAREAEIMIKQLEQNTASLKNALAKLEEMNRRIQEINIDNFQNYTDLSADGISRAITDGVNEYSNLLYTYKKEIKLEEVPDPRRDKAAQAKEKLEENKGDKDRDITEAGIKLEELPSRMKAESKSFSEEDDGVVENENTPVNNNTGLPSESINYSGNLNNLGEEIEFDEDNGGFSEKALGFTGSMGSILGKGLVQLRDEIFMDEYIMGTFKSAVPGLKDVPGHEKDYNFMGVDKSRRDSFFGCEVEYILHGNSSQNINKIMTEGQILLVRFALDTLHVYTDPEKKALAAGVATAVTGWWTAGAGIPVVTNLIMCSWGMGEAVKDLDSLMNGESVPFFKQKGDWKLDIGIGKASGPKADSRLSFTYYDYLRLFLLLKPSEEKINRLEDLIQLNMQKADPAFKMREKNTYIRVEATVSMRYLFITQPFMPSNMKTPDRRHKFKVVVYEGY